MVRKEYRQLYLLKKVSKISYLLNLPNELLFKILSSICHLPTLSNFLQTCKRIGSFNEEILWKNIRINHGLPDPSLINLSNYKMLKAYYSTTKNCNDCFRHCDYVRPIWQFGGVHFCRICLLRISLTVITPLCSEENLKIFIPVCKKNGTFYIIQTRAFK
jgi:hypothetical protein